MATDQKQDKQQQQLVVAKREAASFLESQALITQVKRAISPVMQKYMTADRMLRVVQTAVMRDNRLLEAANHPQGKLTLLTAIMNCAVAGLEPDGRNAHLVAYWNTKCQCYEVQAQFDWKGLVALGLRAGFDTVYPEMVCKNDEFEDWIENGVKKLLHKINRKEPRGEPYLFYCVTLKGGAFDYEIMTMEETEAIRKRSPAGDKGPWKTDTNEMRKKCPIRRMSKRWDLAPEIRQAIFGDADVLPELDKPEPDKPATPLFNVRAETQGLPASNPETDPGLVAEVKEHETLAKSIEAKAKASKMDFKVMAGFLFEMGVTDTALTEIREFPIDVLRTLDNQWEDMVARVNGGQA